MARALPLPSAFVDRMTGLLGPEASDFLAALDEAPVMGLRANTLKVTPAELAPCLPWRLQPTPWCAEGFALTGGEALPGSHPDHAAGLYYIQDPSAMAAGALLDPQPGDRVLDLCGAPGGKSTHLAARLQGRGLLVANELVRSGTAALVENLERFGVANFLVTNASPDALAARWRAVFDAVLVDAPCSGEGMFRKTPSARLEWRPSVVAGCALRQTTILDQAAALVRPGGRLLYATCTFAPDEDEGSVAHFLRSHPDFSLLAAPLPGLDAGRPDWIDPSLATGLSLERCARLWPHRSPGEGHFFALMQREGAALPASLPAATDRLPAAAAGAWQRFAGAMLHTDLPDRGWAVYGDRLHLLPVAPVFWQGVSVVRAGLVAGRLATGRMAPGQSAAGRSAAGRFEPEHALALAAGVEMKPEGCLDLGEAAALAYLRGDTLAAPGPDGWVQVKFGGFGLGWGKRVQGVVKNHYPRGLRLRA